MSNRDVFAEFVLEPRKLVANCLVEILCGNERSPRDGCYQALLDRPGVPAADDGRRVWPLDLWDRPADIRTLLAKPLLDGAETERVTAHWSKCSVRPGGR